MKKQELTRNITIGLTDGITIPFALVAGLAGAIQSTLHIAAAGVSLAAAGAITMGIGAYLEQARSHRTESSVTTPLIISLSYLAGGLLAVIPFLFSEVPSEALLYSSALSLSSLFVAGYFESKINDANPWIGAIRVMVTGAVAGSAAFYVAKLFV